MAAGLCNDFWSVIIIALLRFSLQTGRRPGWGVEAERRFVAERHAPKKQIVTLPATGHGLGSEVVNGG